MKTARKPDYEPGSGGVIPEIWPTFQSSDSFMHIGPFFVTQWQVNKWLKTKFWSVAIFTMMPLLRQVMISWKMKATLKRTCHFEASGPSLSLTLVPTGNMAVTACWSNIFLLCYPVKHPQVWWRFWQFRLYEKGPLGPLLPSDWRNLRTTLESERVWGRNYVTSFWFRHQVNLPIEHEAGGDESHFC